MTDPQDSERPAWLQASRPKKPVAEQNAGISLNPDEGLVEARVEADEGSASSVSISADDEMSLQLARWKSDVSWLARLLGRSPHRLHLRLRSMPPGQKPASIELVAEVKETDVEGLPWLELGGREVAARTLKQVAGWSLASGADLARWRPEDTIAPEERDRVSPGPGGDLASVGTTDSAGTGEGQGEGDTAEVEEAVEDHSAGSESSHGMLWHFFMALLLWVPSSILGAVVSGILQTAGLHTRWGTGLGMMIGGLGGAAIFWAGSAKSAGSSATGKAVAMFYVPVIVLLAVTAPPNVQPAAEIVEYAYLLEPGKVHYTSSPLRIQAGEGRAFFDTSTTDPMTPGLEAHCDGPPAKCVKHWQAVKSAQTLRDEPIRLEVLEDQPGKVVVSVERAGNVKAWSLYWKVAMVLLVLVVTWFGARYVARHES